MPDVKITLFGATQIQYEVAVRLGWTVRPVGRQFGLFDPDQRMIGVAQNDPNACWMVGLGATSSIPKFAQSADAAWSLLAGLDYSVTGGPATADDGFNLALMVRVQVGLSRAWIDNHEMLAELICQAWLEHCQIVERANVDHADA